MNTNGSKNVGGCTGERDRLQENEGQVSEETAPSNITSSFQNQSVFTCGNSLTTNAAAAILQNNVLRKSLQSSSTGLRQIHATTTNSNYMQ